MQFDIRVPFGRKAYSAGAAIGRLPVTVNPNHGMVVGAEEKNNPQDSVLPQIAFCGRAMRAPTLSYSGVHLAAWALTSSEAHS